MNTFCLLIYSGGADDVLLLAAGKGTRQQGSSREVLWLARNFLLHLQILIVVGWGFQCPW